MDIRQLEYLVAVADQGGFTSAAAVVHTSQPSLSHGIKSLENELGIELFARLGRTVRTTAAGELVIDAARQVLRDVATLRATAAAASGVAVGRLDLVALPTLAAEPLAPLVGRFRHEHPGVTVRLLEPESGHELVDLVRSGRAEIGLTDVARTRSGLRTVKLFTQELLAICPPRTPIGDDGALRPAELARLPLVTTPEGTSTRELLEAALRRAGATVDVAVEVAHREAIVPLVVAGAGAALVPASVAGQAARRGAVVASLKPPVHRSIGIVHRRGPLSPAASAFIALATKTRR